MTAVYEPIKQRLPGFWKRDDEPRNELRPARYLARCDKSYSRSPAREQMRGSVAKDRMLYASAHRVSNPVAISSLEKLMGSTAWLVSQRWCGRPRFHLNVYRRRCQLHAAFTINSGSRESLPCPPGAFHSAIHIHLRS